MLLPLGDQVGCCSNSRPVVNWVRPLPSALTVNRSQLMMLVLDEAKMMVPLRSEAVLDPAGTWKTREYGSISVRM